MILLGAIPRIIRFGVILVVGWFIASLVGRGLAGFLRLIDFNGLAQRSGLGAFIANTGLRTDASGALAMTAKWFVRLIALIVAFDALGLPAVSQVLQRLLLWLPNLVVAVVILVIAGLVANALSGVVRGASASAGLPNPSLLATITTIAAWGFGVIVAVNQIGIASTFLNTLFMGLVGALALAFGLAFGLGGRDTASHVVRSWYEKTQQAGPTLRAATEVAAAEGREQTHRRPAA